MESAVLNPVPGMGAVAREQFRSVGLSLRREALVAGGFIGLASAWLLMMQTNLRHAEVPFTPEAGVPAAILALLVPMAVWKGEGPAGRGYHRAMPVNHFAHAVIRSVSGLAWLLVAIAGYFTWLGFASAFTGGPWDVNAAAYQWAVPFTGAAVMYLLGSALTLATAHPWRWLGGAVVSYMFMGALRAADGTPILWDGINTLLSGTYGIGTVITGLSPVWSEYGVQHMANVSVWLLSTWLWLAIAISVFLFAAYKQPER